MTFEFSTAGRILFGEGILDQVGTYAAKLGSRILVVGGGTTARNEPLLTRLEEKQLSLSTFSVVSEPTVALVLEGTAQARSCGADLIIGMGGGLSLIHI